MNPPKCLLILSLIICSILNICCDDKNRKIIKPLNPKVTELPYLIELEPRLCDKTEMELSQIGSIIKYTALETNKKCLIDRISRIVLTNDYIFISDSKKLLKFDNTGNFLSIVGGIGKGNGEYLWIFDFDVDEENERIYLLDYAKKVEVYSLDGQSLRSFYWEYPTTTLRVIDENLLAFKIANIPNNNEQSSLILTDSIGNIIKDFHSHQQRKSQPGLVVDNTPIYEFQGNIRFLEFGSDTLFTLHQNSLVPYAVFNLGDLKMNPDPILPADRSHRDEILKELNKKLWVNDILECQRYIFIKLQYGLSDTFETAVFDKHLGKTNFLVTKALSNNIDRGISLFPKYFYNDKTFLDYHSAYEMFDKPLENSIPDSILSLINDESNPIVIMLE